MLAVPGVGGGVDGGVDPPTVSTIRPVEQPAVLVDGQAPYCVVDANAEWLAACSYTSVDEVVGKTLSIIQGPRVSHPLHTLRLRNRCSSLE